MQIRDGCAHILSLFLQFPPVLISSPFRADIGVGIYLRIGNPQMKLEQRSSICFLWYTKRQFHVSRKRSHMAGGDDVAVASGRVYEPKAVLLLQHNLGGRHRRFFYASGRRHRVSEGLIDVSCGQDTKAPYREIWDQNKQPRSHNLENFLEVTTQGTSPRPNKDSSVGERLSSVSLCLKNQLRTL